MTQAPLAPWPLGGESLVGLVAARLPPSTLPAGLVRIPGPVLMAAVAYVASPVGPYLELAIGQPARLGARVGWCLTTMVVDSTPSRLGGRLNWGFPKQVGTLVWEADGRERRLRWVERELEVRGHVSGPPLPFLVPVRTLQRRRDGPVVVPGRLRGRARLTRLHVSVPEGDDLSRLGGRHAGIHVAGMRVLIRPARQPVGLTSTLRAPLRAPEPALFLVDVMPFRRDGLTDGRLAQR